MNARRIAALAMVTLAALASIATSEIEHSVVNVEERHVIPLSATEGWTRAIRVCASGTRSDGSADGERFPDVPVEIEVEHIGLGELAIEVIGQLDDGTAVRTHKTFVQSTVTRINFEASPEDREWCSNPITIHVMPSGPGAGQTRLIVRTMATFVSPGDLSIEQLEVAR